MRLKLTCRRRRRADCAQARYAGLKARHVEALMEKKGGPEAANRLKKDLGQLFPFAAKRYGFAGQNPASVARGSREAGPSPEPLDSTRRAANVLPAPAAAGRTRTPWPGAGRPGLRRCRPA